MNFDLPTHRYTGATYKYPLDSRGTAIGDFTMFDTKRGLVIERDESQGSLDGFKAIFEIKLQGKGDPVDKLLLVDLLNIADPGRISEPGHPGDVGIGERFAFPFVTIESVYVIDRRTIGVLNDNNFPFSVDRHVGSGKPDDNELILVRLEKPLSAPVRSTGFALDTSLNRHGDGQHLPLISELDFDATRQTAQHDRRDLFAKLREAVARGRIPQLGLWLSGIGVLAERISE
jgi:hypothetical protein